MSDKKGFDLGDYVEVRERIAIFYEMYGAGRLVTGEVRLSNEPDGKPRVMVQGLAYRTPDDPLPGVGWSWMELPGTTSYTKGSELENTETSAWGRAIASLGILIDRSIASANEIAAKGGETKRPPAGSTAAALADLNASPRVSPDGLVGTIEVGKPSAKTDFELRETPDGWLLGFRLISPNGGIKVVCTGILAEQLSMHRDALVGQRVTCWGTIDDESFTPQAAPDEKPHTVVYQVLALTRLTGAGLDLPMVEAAPTVDDFPMFGAADIPA